MAHLALTIGDPTGIGPEITVKTLQRLNEFKDIKFSVIGSMKALEAAAKQLNKSLPYNEQVEYHVIEDARPGAVAYQAIDKAVAMIAAREAESLVTGPISKKHLQDADYHFHGHTEILEELTRRYFGINDVKAEMLFAYQPPPRLRLDQAPDRAGALAEAGKNFRLMLLTRHVPLRGLPQALAEKEKVEKSFSILIGFLHKIGIATPKLAVLGANPHAGEIGGIEEEKVLKPLIEDLQRTGLAECDGPLAADAFFRGFTLEKNNYDAIVAAYHDQGLIPFKMLAGFEAVNISIGLPFLRTSVGHGTAEDIAGKGIASEDSLIAAIQMAVKLV